jgi:hypothetical protein
VWLPHPFWKRHTVSRGRNTVDQGQIEKGSRRVEHVRCAPKTFRRRPGAISAVWCQVQSSNMRVCGPEIVRSPRQQRGTMVRPSALAVRIYSHVELGRAFDRAGRRHSIPRSDLRRQDFERCEPQGAGATAQTRKQNGKPAVVVARPECRVERRGTVMQTMKVSAGRRPRHSRELRRSGLYHARASARLNDCCHADFIRLSRPRLAAGAKRPPYVELAVTVAAFLFVLFVAFGGASPTEPDVVLSSILRPR